jgi:transposase-like protein
MSKRSNLTPQQKVAIVREHLIDGIPVSDLCDKHDIHATQYYNWQKQLFENAEQCFQRKTNTANDQRQKSSQQKKIDLLEAKIQAKNEVVAELLEEHVKLKKASGEP